MQMEKRCFEAQPSQFRWIGYEANQFLRKVREAQAEKDNNWLFLYSIWLELYA